MHALSDTLSLIYMIYFYCLFAELYLWRRKNRSNLRKWWGTDLPYPFSVVHILNRDKRHGMRNPRATSYELSYCFRVIIFRASVKFKNCSWATLNHEWEIFRESMQKRPSTLIRSYCVLRRERNYDWAISQVPSFVTRITRRVETSGKTCISVKLK